MTDEQLLESLKQDGGRSLLNRIQEAAVQLAATSNQMQLLAEELQELLDWQQVGQPQQTEDQDDEDWYKFEREQNDMFKPFNFHHK